MPHRPSRSVTLRILPISNITTNMLVGKGFIHDLNRTKIIISRPAIMAFVAYWFIAFLPYARL
jgi:hypothetical protein